MLNRLEKALMATNRWALILLLGAMAVIVFANVALRYLTDESIPWADEVARHMMIWLTFLGAGPVLRYGGHIAVENLQDALPKTAAAAVRIIIALSLFAFFLFLAWSGWTYVQRTMVQLTAVTQIPFGYIYSAMPIGAVLLIAHWALVVRGYVTHRQFAVDGNFDATASASL